jgi:hypothetical protein
LCAFSKVDPCPEPAHECVRNPASTTWPDDVLQVGLKDQCGAEKPETVGRLERRFISLNSGGGISLRRAQMHNAAVVLAICCPPQDWVSRDRDLQIQSTPHGGSGSFGVCQLVSIYDDSDAEKRNGFRELACVSKVVALVREEFSLSKRPACNLLAVHRSTCRYEPKRTAMRNRANS